MIKSSGNYSEKGSGRVLTRLWDQLGHEDIVVQETSQAIFIGIEALLSNITFLVHHLIENPECVDQLRSELDTLDSGQLGHQVWHDPKVLRLPYMVRLSLPPLFLSLMQESGPNILVHKQMV